MNHYEILTDKSYYRLESDTELLEETIWQRFNSVVSAFPENEAVVSIPQKKRLTYRELKEKIDLLACGLLALGCDSGCKVGIWSTNNLEWLLVQLACARIGGVLVNINPAYRVPELAYGLELAEVEFLFTIPSFRFSNYVQMLLELVPELAHVKFNHLQSRKLTRLKRVILYDPENPSNTIRPCSGFTVWQDVLEMAEKIDCSQLDRLTSSQDVHDPVNIQFTSGTTGAPKAVALSHHNIVNNSWSTAQIMEFTENDRLCMVVPLYHCFGTVLASLLCFTTGGCLVIGCDHFDPGLALRAVETEQCTAIHGVPTMFIAELDHPDFAQFDLSCLRTGIMAGAPCSPELMKRVIEEMGCTEILIGYGETEASPLTHLTRPDDSVERRTKTVGRNLPHQEVKVVDPVTGEIVLLGEQGEICFRGYHVMLGYYRNKKATEEAIDPQGWLHSGDLGTMDQDGYVKITGRLKNMIIRGGENIYPREIEECLFSHPDVAEAAVFGIPDDYWGEEVMAWVRLHASARTNPEELKLFCRENLAHFKVPNWIKIVNDFPMTVTGKLQKFKMKEMAIKELAHGFSRE